MREGQSERPSQTHPPAIKMGIVKFVVMNAFGTSITLGALRTHGILDFNADVIPNARARVVITKFAALGEVMYLAMDLGLGPTK